MNLTKKLKEMGLIVNNPSEIIGKSFGFKEGEDEIFGTITGVRTSDDGLPVIEVSNKRFAGLFIKNIMLTSNNVAGDVAAYLYTTVEKGILYYENRGYFHLF